MAGNTYATQAALVASATTSYVTRGTQVAITGSFKTAFRTRGTQVAIVPTVWTAFRTRGTQIGIVAWVMTCSSSSYVPPDPTGVITLTAVSAGLNTGEVDLSWTALSGFTYALYRGTSPGGEGGTPIASGLTGTTYTDSGLAYHATYYYKIIGTNACADTTASNESAATVDCTVPDPVMGLTAVEGPGDHQATLRWTAIEGCTYDVYRAVVAGGEGDTPIASGLTAPVWIDPYAPHEGLAYYQVAAINGCGLGALSTEVAVRMHCCTPWTAGDAPCPGWDANTTPAPGWTPSSAPCPGWNANTSPVPGWTPASAPPTGWTPNDC